MTTSSLQHNVINNKTFRFAVSTLTFSQTFQEQQHLALFNQLLESVTPIGANTREAQSVENKADFTYRFKIAAKQAN